MLQESFNFVQSLKRLGLLGTFVFLFAQVGFQVFAKAGSPLDPQRVKASSAAWVNLKGGSYCSTPDRTFFMRPYEATEQDIYLYVRTSTSEEIEYYLLSVEPDMHVYRRLDRSAVNFPYFIEATQLFNDTDTLTFKDRNGRVLKTFQMRFSYDEQRGKSCQ